MGDKHRFARWIAVSIVTIVIMFGSSAAEENDVHADAQNKTPAMPSNYHLPEYDAGSRPPAQPIPFSHAHHVGTLALECAVCHVGAGPNADEDGRSKNGKHMTLPGTQTCMNCHVAIATNSPNIQVLAKHHAAGEDVQWVRVYRVLKGVNWTHKAHLGTGIECQTCHGDVAKMDVMAVATPVTAMASCLNCHRASQASSQCETCHAWPGADDFRRWED